MSDKYNLFPVKSRIGYFIMLFGVGFMFLPFLQLYGLLIGFVGLIKVILGWKDSNIKRDLKGAKQ